MTKETKYCGVLAEDEGGIEIDACEGALEEVRKWARNKIEANPGCVVEIDNPKTGEFVEMIDGILRK